MKKIFQNKSLLKSIQIFLVCLVVLGGVGNSNIALADDLWVGQHNLGGVLKSCDSSGTCADHSIGGAAGSIRCMAKSNNRLWIGGQHLYSCDSSGTCDDHGDKGGILCMAEADGKIWIGGRYFQACETSGANIGECTDYGDKGGGIYSMAVFNGKLWLGQHSPPASGANGHLQSCETSGAGVGTCIDYGSINPAGLPDTSYGIFAMAVFNGELWLGQFRTASSAGYVQSCDATGFCTDHGPSGGGVHSLSVFDGNLWIGQEGGGLSSCDSAGNYTHYGDMGSSIYSMAAFDGKLWTGDWNGGGVGGGFGSLKSYDSSATQLSSQSMGSGVMSLVVFGPPPPPPLPSCTLTANPTSIDPEESSVLRWTTENTDSARINGDTVDGADLPNGSKSVSPSSATSYTMTVVNTAGDTGSCSAMVGVMIPPPCEKGLVPCGRRCDAPGNSYDESQPCTLCHLILMMQLIMDFLFKIAAVVAALFIAASGTMYIFATGRPEMLSLAKTTFKLTLLGFTLIFIAWILVNTILTMFGYIDPLENNEWHIMC